MKGRRRRAGPAAAWTPGWISQIGRHLPAPGLSPTIRAPMRFSLPFALLLGLTLLGACEQAPRSAPKPTPSAAPQPAQATPPPVPRPAPWYEGTWQAEVELLPQPSPLEAEKLQAEKEDRSEQTRPAGQTAGKAAVPGAEAPADPKGTDSNPTQLRVAIDAAGAARGEFGELSVRGVLDGETLRARAEHAGAAGVVLATRTDAGLSGTVRLSSGDSQQVWFAQFLLRRVAATPSGVLP